MVWVEKNPIGSSPKAIPPAMRPTITTSSTANHPHSVATMSFDVNSRPRGMGRISR